MNIKSIIIGTIILGASFSSFANEEYFSSACYQKVISGDATRLLHIKKQQHEKYEEALKLAQDSATSICQCITTNLNDQFEIRGLDKIESFKRIGKSFATGNKYYMSRSLQLVLGEAGTPCTL